MRKGQTVFYDIGMATYRGKVLTVHRDGSATILSEFRVSRETKKDYPGYFGYKYRVDASVFRFAA